MTTDCIKLESSNGILSLVINRPHKKNALDSATFNNIAYALNAARQDDKINVVVISGEGGNFCSGMDLSASFDEGSKPYDDCAQAFADFDKPIIAAVNGIAIGGGATISLHCDIVYVSPSLKMRLPFVNLGLVPEFASSYTLQASIGTRRAAELMYTAQWIDANTALDFGIATAIIEDDQLLHHAMKKAQEIAQWPVRALQATKQCLKEVHRESIQKALKKEGEMMAKQAGSPENIEAIMAFMEKREPDFKKLIK